MTKLSTIAAGLFLAGAASAVFAGQQQAPCTINFSAEPLENILNYLHTVGVPSIENEWYQKNIHSIVFTVKAKDGSSSPKETSAFALGETKSMAVSCDTKAYEVSSHLSGLNPGLTSINAQNDYPVDFIYTGTISFSNGTENNVSFPNGQNWKRA